MTRKNTGFTLVEILIVVIILGILAAIVIPQFTEASNDARESALTSDLQTVRSQLELYKVQHLEVYAGSLDAGATFSAANFLAQMTSRTNNAGVVMPADGLAKDYPLGPYLQKFPTNAFVSGDGDKVTVSDTAGTGAGDTGWFFDSKAGKFSPNDAKHKDL